VVEDAVRSVLHRRAVLAGVGAAIIGGTTATAWSLLGERGFPAGKNMAHQPGVVTDPPPAAALAAFDISGHEPSSLASILRILSDRIDRAANSAGPKVETTIAVGASLFDDRFGLSGQAPRRLTSMPSFPNDVLDPSQCHGDLLLQVCAPDSTTADSAMHLVTDAVPGLLPRWHISGFRDENTTTADGRPSNRDLFGFREGAANLDTRDAGTMDRLVWVTPDGDEPAWTAGGSYQVVRQIRFAPALWDSEPISRQESVVGRRKADGAPLGHDHETAAFDYSTDPAGQVTALDAHIRRADPRTPETDGSKILRRGYSFRTPADSAGRRDEGLVFICFQRDLERGFETVQRRLEGQSLDKYVLTVGGGYFFVLPGRSPEVGGFIGSSLVGAAQQ
jgi:deferrochelatase/peroxidase EfeB